MNRISWVVSGVVTLLLLSAYGVKGYFLSETRGSRSVIQSPIKDRNPAKVNQHTIDSAVSILKSGDILLRTGLGADSYMLAKMNQKDKTYSHCGIVLIENGYPFVYHAIGGEDNPDQRLRRDSASVFLSPLHNEGFGIVAFEFNNDEVHNLGEVVKEFYKARPKFDMNFDLKTDDALYCSEFVYKALNRAVGDTAYIKTTRALGKTFVGIDDLFTNEHAHMVWRLKFM